MAQKRGHEWLTLTGLREDGRRFGELRAMKVEIGNARSRTVDGSAWLELGQTKVVAHCSGPRELRRRSDEVHDKASIDVTVRIAPFAGIERQALRPTDRRQMELANAVRRTLEGAVMTEMYPRSEIAVVVHVMADDGSRLAACINAASLALVDAGVSMRDVVASASGGLVGEAGDVACDLTRGEENPGGSNEPPTLHVAVLPRSRKVLLAQLSGAPLPVADFEKLLRQTVDAAVLASTQLAAVARSATANATHLRKVTFDANPKKN